MARVICKHCRERIEWVRAPGNNSRTTNRWRTPGGAAGCGGWSQYHEVDLRPGAVREALRDVKNV